MAGWNLNWYPINETIFFLLIIFFNLLILTLLIPIGFSINIWLPLEANFIAESMWYDVGLQINVINGLKSISCGLLKIFFNE